MNDAHGEARGRLGATFVRYTLLGGVSVAVNLAVVACMRELAGMSAAAAGAVGYAVVLVMNFVIARRHVFASHGSWRGQLVRFGLVQSGVRSAEYGAFLLLVYTGRQSYVFAIIVVAAVSFLLKFALYRGYVFGHRGGAAA